MSDVGIPGSTPAQPTPGPDETQETGKTKGSGTGNFAGGKPPISGLKDLTPEEWQKELELLVQGFCHDMKKRSDRVVKEMRKLREG